jgi:cytochrome c oxidase subunit 2
MAGKLWGLFFGLHAVVGLGLFVASPSMGWWFPLHAQAPAGEALSPIGQRIDQLFYLILGVTGVVYVGTQVVLTWTLWRFGTDAVPDGQQPARKPWYSHGNHHVELAWAISPGLVLLYLAFVQMDVWSKFRMRGTVAKEVLSAPVAEVTARQFEWRIRYPAPGKTLQPKPQPDDLYTINDLHVPLGRMVAIRLVSDDVLHSFFIPHLRIKQDAVPGMAIPVWFEALKGGTYELVCAELCGWGHYKMRGEVTAESPDEFAAYLGRLAKQQSSDGVSEQVAQSEGTDQ